MPRWALHPHEADCAGSAPPADPHWSKMDGHAQLKRLRYQAWHRGTREADLLIGGFFDAHHASWNANHRAQFAELLDEQDADIIAWATGTRQPPTRFEGPLIEALRRLDYVRTVR